MEKPDEELLQISYEERLKSSELVLIHLRDARNIVYSLSDIPENRALSKSGILLATAALESNLSYLSNLALRYIEARPAQFGSPHADFIKCVKTEIDENGKLVERRIRHSLAERMQKVPRILAKAVGREFTSSPHSAAARKMNLTLARRDAIIHPRWEHYLSEAGWWEAAEAVDAVELYLHHVDQSLHPYGMYSTALYTIKGPTKNDLGIGHRTFGKRGPKRKVSTMQDVHIVDLLLGEWLDSMFMTEMAFKHESEADSDGSMLTRAALVFLYAMLDAQLSVVAQWKMHEGLARFSEPEILFLNEIAAGVGHDGEIWLDSGQYSFKRRIKAIPAVIARRVDEKEFAIDLGAKWGHELLKGYVLRSQVMHSTLGEPLPRISKEELRTSVRAVRALFESMAMGAPKSFGHLTILLEGFDPTAGR